MDTSELLRPLNIFWLALILALAFVAACRIESRPLRILVRRACLTGLMVSVPLLAFMLFARGTPYENNTEITNGPFGVLVRSQEFHHSGIINIDVCVTEASKPKFPRNEKRQCFLHGYDFSGLSVKWVSQRNIEIVFDCGRVTEFRNSALVYPSGPVPVEFYATLNDSCGKHAH